MCQTLLEALGKLVNKTVLDRRWGPSSGSFVLSTVELLEQQSWHVLCHVPCHALGWASLFTYEYTPPSIFHPVHLVRTYEHLLCAGTGWDTAINRTATVSVSNAFSVAKQLGIHPIIAPLSVRA